MYAYNGTYGSKQRTTCLANGTFLNNKCEHENSSELIDRIEEILKDKSIYCAKDYLLQKMFNFFDTASLIAFIEYLERDDAQDTSNLN